MYIYFSNTFFIHDCLNFVIYSDSQSERFLCDLHGLRKFDPFFWIPHHMGLSCIVKADVFAKRAVQLPLANRYVLPLHEYTPSFHCSIRASLKSRWDQCAVDSNILA